MQRVDLSAFEALMQEMAEVYDRKPYTPAAIKHWFEALAEFHFDKVRYKLKLWRDSSAKQPTISDIVKPLRDAVSDEIERRAIEDKKAFARAPTPVTRIGSAAMAEIRGLMRSKRKPGNWWAYELRDAQQAGKGLYYAQEQLARKACGEDWNSSVPYSADAVRERQPGEDDE